MKDFKIPIAIIIAALIISFTLYYNSKNDPLTKCIDRIIKDNPGSRLSNSAIAATICTGKN